MPWPPIASLSVATLLLRALTGVRSACTLAKLWLGVPLRRGRELCLAARAAQIVGHVLVLNVRVSAVATNTLAADRIFEHRKCLIP